MATDQNDLWLAPQNGMYEYQEFVAHIQLLLQRPITSEPNRAFLRNVFAEISEANFLHLSRIQTLLDPLVEDVVFLTIVENNEIRSIGTNINNRGGINAMRICYYTLKRIMMRSSNSMDLEYIWDGIGDWEF